MFPSLFKNINKQYKEIFRYLIVGCLTTIVSLASYYICVATVLNPLNSIELQIANIISWIAAVSFAFFANRWYVFHSQQKKILVEMSSFFCSRLSTLLIDMFIMYVGVILLNYNDKFIKVLVQIIVTVLNYVFSKIFVFSKTN